MGTKAFKGLCCAAIVALVSTVPSRVNADTETFNDPGSPATALTAPSLKYIFPFSRVPVAYVRDHLNYPATDVEGCYAKVLAPTAGIIAHARRKDTWVKEIDDPGTRGGLTITLVGDDTVRYFFSHLGRVKVSIGQRVQPGDWIGVVGSSGNARITRCHTHFGMSRICPLAEIDLLQGELWPWRYLDAWRQGIQLSPRKAKNRLIRQSPDLCTEATTAFRANTSLRDGG
ncbi:MAG: M23 family metallopeptidase [Ilumatobacteraceae bacterium]